MSNSCKHARQSGHPTPAPMILLDPLARPVVGHRGDRAHSPENTPGVDARSRRTRHRRGGVRPAREPRREAGRDARPDAGAHDHGPEDRCAAPPRRNWTRWTPASTSRTDSGRTFPWRGRGVTVPTFDALVETLPRELPLHHRAQDARRHPAAHPRDAIRRHDIAHRVIVAGFDSASACIRSEAPALRSARARRMYRAGLLVPALLRRSVRSLFSRSMRCAFHRAGTAFRCPSPPWRARCATAAP